MVETYKGKPCPYGHDGERYKSNRKCVGCAKVTVLSQKEISRRNKAEAVENGQLFYEGQPCSKGHGNKRRVSTRDCVLCEEDRDRKSRGTESYKERQRRYHQNHLLERRATIRERSKRYRINNPEKCQTTIQQWRDNNKDLVRSYGRNYSAKRRQLERQGVSSRESKEWADSQPKVCYWCGADCKRKYHIDHYIPLSKGGEHATHNFVVACPRCNHSKNAKDPYEYAKECGRLF